MIGEVLSGKYRIIEKIGSGGMADVYKAQQLVSPHRTVAVKVLKTEFQNDAAFLRRFEQEAQAVLVLSHENIVRSYDVGTQGDIPYIVLEYVEGCTLKERIRSQGRMLPRSAINLGAQVLEALSHAHEKGIIHRDVKPQNIIVNPRGRAKLADFGIARNAESTTVTFTGANVLGSVHYLSPEQAKGRQVTVESDIYSMGITLYEMVTGRLPFEGETSVSVALKHLQEEIVPPIMHNPTLPPALNDVIMKATRKQPALRYRSAKEMRQDLLRVLREPTGDFARQAAPEKPKKRKPGRRGIVRIAFAAVALIALFGILLLTGQTIKESSTSASTDLVPTLVGKTLEEAKSTAKLRAYTTEVIETVASDAYPSGVVIEQTPAAGTALKAGGVISISVSAGAAMPLAPDLTGMTLAQAEETLLEAGLNRGEVEYRISEAPVGTVFKQDPVADTSLLEGDEVQLFISGEPSRSIEMPDVTQLPLKEALLLLHDRGFSSFRVRLAPSSENTVEDTVQKQNPVQGESAASTSTIDLMITGIGPEIYTANIVFTLDIADADTNILATVPMEIGGVAYEQVVYESVLAAGNAQEISISAAIGGGGEQELILYQNGTEIRRTPVTFSYLG